MLERLKDLPPGVEGVKAVGKVTNDDFKLVLEPLLDELEREGRRVRFVYQLAPEFEGFTASGAFEDAKAGLRSLRRLDGCALISDVGWVRESSRMVGFLMPCPVRVFENAQWHEALEWLSSLPERAAISHRLLPEVGVVVVEIRGGLRKQDLDDLARTAQPWIDTHGELEGLVIHVREFPGWESLASFVPHARLARDQRRKVKRVALATDSKLAGLAQRVVEYAARAQIKVFRADQLEDAIAWAAGPGSRSESPPLGAPATSSSA